MAIGADFCARLGIEIPIVQAPMAGAGGVALAIAVAQAGGLGSLPAAMLSNTELSDQIAEFRRATDAPLNVNFFCHQLPDVSSAELEGWAATVSRFDAELGVDRSSAPAGPARRPFDDEACRIVEDHRPEVVSFHFGLPAPTLLERVRRTGAIVMSSATIRAEAVWLEQHSCDVVIAQGAEAGGHRGMFLTTDVAAQPGTLALLPRVVDSVGVPVIAAGGLADGRAIAAAFVLGAAAVQLGTAYLLCPEALTTPVHRRALADGSADDTVLTNVLTGRPARGRRNRVIDELGPMAAEAPAFPAAGAAIAPLRVAAEAAGSGDFSPLWSGQAGVVTSDVPAGRLTRELIADVRRILGG
ncbi:MAG: nitronate monooxygenase [Ilumatobacteraceae bacterium]